MSKYNINDIVCRLPFAQVYTKSELTSPNAIRQFINQISNVNKKIDEINSLCKIVFFDNVIVFTPRLRSKASISEIIYARDYIRKILSDLGFDTYIYHDHRYCSTVSLSLLSHKNQERLHQLGNVFKFQYKSPVLTQSILDSIRQNKR